CGQTILRKGQQTGSAWTINYEVRKAMFIFTLTCRRVGKAILLPLSGGEFTGNHPARQINRLAFLESMIFRRF
ncbi:hypothetical protein ACS0TW_42370, partial [Klebsiella michiganensis]